MTEAVHRRTAENKELQERLLNVILFLHYI